MQTKMIGPSVAAIEGSVTKALPPTTPASPASPQPRPNTSISTRGTLWPSASTICGCVSAAWITRPMRVRVISSHSATSMAMAVAAMNMRVAGNGEQDTRTAASAARHMASGALPHTAPNPSTEECMSVNAGTCSDSGGRKSSATRPHTSCTISTATKDRPKVISSSGTWPNLWVRRRAVRSNTAPSTPTTTGATSSAGQKPISCAIECPM